MVSSGNEDDGHVVLWDDLSQKEKQRCGLVRAVAGQERQAAKITAGGGVIEHAGTTAVGGGSALDVSVWWTVCA